MSKQFILLEAQLCIDEDRVNYNTLRKQFVELSNQAELAFREMYIESNTSLEDVSKKAFKQGDGCIQDVINKTVTMLLEKGILDISVDLLYKQYKDTEYYSFWVEAFEEINSKYMEIVCDQQQLDQYRTQRRMNRARMVGGGFGVEGAVKGMATAGSINLAGGAVHGAFNLIGKGISSSIAAADKRAIFKDKNTLDTLANGVYNACYFIHYIYINTLEKRVADTKYRTVKQVEADKAENIFKNLQNPAFPEDKIVSTLIEILSLNPYESSYYGYIFKKYGDEKRELQEIADYFGANLNVHKVDELIGYYNGLDVGNEEEAHKVKEQVLAYCDGINLTYNNVVVEHIDSEIVNYDRLFRTVNGIELATREEAVLAKEEKTKIEVYIQGVLEIPITELEEELEKAIHKIKSEYKTAIKEGYIQTLKNKKQQCYNEKLNLAKQFYKTLETYDEEKAIKSKQKLLDYCIQIKLAHDNEIVKKIDKIIVKHDHNYRTVEGITFVKRAEADTAREEKQIFEQIIENLKVDQDVQSAREKLEQAGTTELKKVYFAKIADIEKKIEKQRIKDEKKQELLSIRQERQHGLYVKRAERYQYRINNGKKIHTGNKALFVIDLVLLIQTVGLWYFVMRWRMNREKEAWDIINTQSNKQ